MKRFKAILFDFDGVLADTMEDNFLAWKQAFEDYKIKIERKDYFPLEGMKLEEIAKTISKKYNLNELESKNIVNLKNKYYLNLHSFKFYPGVLELIVKLKKQGLKLAIVSASPKNKLDKTVPLEFLQKFDVIISGDDVKNGKPNPEPYLAAINRLGISKEQATVIENSPLGIKSAKSAGIFCVALTTTLDKKYLEEADKIFDNINELMTMLIK